MRKRIGLRNFYFNRFLAIRYATALFLFLNLYWSIFLLGSLSAAAIIPLCLFILGILTALEQIKLYRNHSNQLPYALMFHKAIFGVSFFLLITIYSPLYHLWYPFLKNTQEAVNFLSILLIINSIISFLIIKKLKNIKHDQDSYFKKMQSYEQITH